MRFLSRFTTASVALLMAAAGGCYDIGDGTKPPLENFYFPVGLQVSHGGSVLYVVNSDFDLQYNGGTLQSYDLRLIRNHVLKSIEDPNHPELPLVRRNTGGSDPCPGDPPIFKEGGGRQPLGETCAPPVDSPFYVRDSAVIGAFASDLQLSLPPDRLIPNIPRLPVEGRACGQDVDCCEAGDNACLTGASRPFACIAPAGASSATCELRSGTRRFDRLFAPVRGNATLTWASVERDTFDSAPPASRDVFYGPFKIQCGQDANSRCDHLHQVGEDPDEPGNTRGLTMPGEPFGMAISPDGESIVITHQNETRSSLYTTGLSRNQNDDGTASFDGATPPAIQFVVDEVPFGGVGIAAIPHDRDAFPGATALPRPAFFETSRAIPQVSLIRQYADEFGGVGASVRRPFLDVETTIPITAAAGGTDSRGIAIDPTPRLACKARILPADPAKGRTEAQVAAELVACARKSARVFIANRTPPALLVGDVGITEGTDGAYDPDRLVIHTSVPLAGGASKVYLAPIVERDGTYALRVFVVCFDTAQVFIYDPDGGALENVIRVGPGPFALAFDPFDMNDVARRLPVPFDNHEPGKGLRRYRFAYLASFTQSYVQVIDLDNAQPNHATFERVVFTLGTPTNPKGT